MQERDQYRGRIELEAQDTEVLKAMYNREIRKLHLVERWTLRAVVAVGVAPILFETLSKTNEEPTKAVLAVAFTGTLLGITEVATKLFEKYSAFQEIK